LAEESREHEAGRGVGVVHRDLLELAGGRAIEDFEIEVLQIITAVALLHVGGVVDAAYIVQVDAAEILAEEGTFDPALCRLVEVKAAPVEELHINHPRIE